MRPSEETILLPSLITAHNNLKLAPPSKKDSKEGIFPFQFQREQQKRKPHNTKKLNDHNQTTIRENSIEKLATKTKIQPHPVTHGFKKPSYPLFCTP
jgi:hypothetical protein